MEGRLGYLYYMNLVKQNVAVNRNFNINDGLKERWNKVEK